MKTSRPLLPLLLLLLTAFALAPVPRAAHAQHTPRPGSKERKALMDAARVPVQKQLKKPVIFKVDALKVQGAWAFLRGVPLQPNGKPMDYKGTIYEESIREGAFSGMVCALMKREKGKWKVVDYAIGPSDVAWDDWDKRYGAPSSIFKVD